MQESVDQLLLKTWLLTNQARELFLAKLTGDCAVVRVLVTVPAQDIGAGELMVQELEQTLLIPVQLVSMEELANVLNQTSSGTVVTSRFIAEAEAIAAPKSVRVIPVDIYDYAQEIQLLKNCLKTAMLA